MDGGPPKITVGPEAVPAITDAFDLQRFAAAGCVLSSVEPGSDSIRLLFDWAGVGSVVVSVAPDDGRPSYASTGNLSFCLIGADVSRPWAVLIARMAASAGSMKMADVARLAGSGLGPADQSASPAKPAEFNPILFWAPEEGWRRFMCDAAMERRFREAFEFDSDSSFIVHGDLECRFVSPGARVRLPGHFVYPFDLFSHHEAVGPITGLDDNDVIMDSTRKIDLKVRRELLDGTFRGPVVVISTCVPVIVAEDPTNVLRGLDEVCPEGISYVTPVSPHSPSEIFMQSFAGLRGRILSRPGRPETVGLVGYRPGRALSELQELLELAGLSVSGAIVPLVTRRLLHDTLCAETIVIAPSRLHDAMYDGLVEGAAESGRRVIRPVFPWGIDATVRWLEAICADCGIEVPEAAIARAEWARRFTGPGQVGKSFIFVCDPSEASRLVDPVSPAGLPIVPMMCGLGLSVRLFVHGDDGDAGFALETVRNGIPAGEDLVQAASFVSRQDLDGLLREDDVAAVYSEMFFERRATRAGVPAFSPRIFEPGIDGALRTLRRFQRLASLPFYRRYMAGSRFGPAGRAL